MALIYASIVKLQPQFTVMACSSWQQPLSIQMSAPKQVKFPTTPHLTLQFTYSWQNRYLQVPTKSAAAPVTVSSCSWQHKQLCYILNLWIHRTLLCYTGCKKPPTLCLCDGFLLSDWQQHAPKPFNTTVAVLQTSHVLAWWGKRTVK